MTTATDHDHTSSTPFQSEPNMLRASNMLQAPTLEQRLPTELALGVIIKPFYATDTNTVQLNPGDFRQIFPHAEADQPQYVQVAHRVFRAVSKPGMPVGSIGMNRIQKMQISPYTFLHQDIACLTATPYDPQSSLPATHPAHYLELELKLPKDVLPTETIRIDANELREELRKQLADEILGPDQKFVISYHGLPLKVIVEDMKVGGGGLAAILGQLEKDADIRFVSGTPVIAIVEKVPPEKVEHIELLFELEATDIPPPWTAGIPCTPYALSETELQEAARKAIGDLTFAESDRFAVDLDDYRRIKITVRDVKVSRDVKTPPAKRTFTLTDSSQFKIDTASTILIRDEQESLSAEQVKFYVKDAAPHQTKGRNKNNFISAEELEAAIRAHYDGQTLFTHQKFMVELSTGKYLVEAHFVRPHADDADKVSEEKATPWTLETDSKIKFGLHGDVDLKIVDSAQPYPLESVEFSISTSKEGKEGLLALFGLDEDENFACLEESEVHDLLREVLPDLLFHDQKLSTKTPDGETLNFEVHSWALTQKDNPRTQYKFLGEVTKDTKITFAVNQDAGLTLLRDQAEINLENIEEEMKKLRLGGLKDQLERVVRDIVLARGKLKELYSVFGLTPPAGLLLYGPPGTGKTTLGRQAGHLLGCTDDRIIMISAGDLLDKYVGETEKMIADLFKPAQQAYDQQGDQAQLYVIMIDEFETVFGSRATAEKSWEKTRVGQLLAKMDGPKRLPNVLVIGITNYKEAIDEALLRPGRFDTHIEFSLPDEKGRTEIFEIYTDPIKEKGCLAGNIDIAALARETDGCAGADIKGIVTGAAGHMFARLIKELGNELNQLSAAELVAHPKAKLTKRDFANAIKDQREGKRANGPPPGWYM